MSRLLQSVIFILVICCFKSGFAKKPELSGKVWVHNETQNIVAFPNPFTESVKIVFYSPGESDYTLIMTDITGRTVYKDKFTAVAGEITKTIGQLSEFPKGTYTVSISNGHDTPLTVKIQH